MGQPRPRSVGADPAEVLAGGVEETDDGALDGGDVDAPAGALADAVGAVGATDAGADDGTGALLGGAAGRTVAGAADAGGGAGGGGGVHARYAEPATTVTNANATPTISRPICWRDVRTRPEPSHPSTEASSSAASPAVAAVAITAGGAGARGVAASATVGTATGVPAVSSQPIPGPAWTTQASTVSSAGANFRANPPSWSASARRPESAWIAVA